MYEKTLNLSHLSVLNPGGEGCLSLALRSKSSFWLRVQGRPPKPCPVLMYFEGPKPDPQIARFLHPDEKQPPNATQKNRSQCNETPTLVSWSNRCLVVLEHYAFYPFSMQSTVEALEKFSISSRTAA